MSKSPKSLSVLVTELESKAKINNTLFRSFNSSCKSLLGYSYDDLKQIIRRYQIMESKRQQVPNHSTSNASITGNAARENSIQKGE